VVITLDVGKGTVLFGRYSKRQEPGCMPLRSAYSAHMLMNIKLARTENFTWLTATSTLKHSPQTNVKEFSVH